MPCLFILFCHLKKKIMDSGSDIQYADSPQWQICDLFPQSMVSDS